MSKRYNIDRRKSTKSERLFHECLKELHIPFKHRWIIQGKEVDFIIGKYVIEIDGHKQNPIKNHLLFNARYIPIHFNNNEINSKQNIKLWLEQIFL